MKKNVFYLMLASLMLFMTVSVMEMNAQVTIGEDTAPHPGAVLELRGGKGLLLPRVSLDDASVFQLSTEKKEEAVGMLVYNLSNKKENGLKGEGVYVWNGQNWTLVAKSEKNILVSDVKIKPENNVTTVAPGGRLKIEAEIEPANATNKGLFWSVSAGSIDAATGMFTAGATTGDVTISAQTVDGSNITSNVITIKVGTPVTRVEISTQTGALTVAPGGTLPLSAIVTPGNASNQSLNWSVDPNSAGSVNTSSKVFTAGSVEGNVNITAISVDGGVRSNTLTIEIKATSNTVQGQNGEYAIHTFGTAGTWMVENSKEGTGYAGNNAAGEPMSGLYYTSAQIAAACPGGYVIPTLSQWNDLKAYLASSSATAEEKMMWFGTPRTGFFASGTNYHTQPGYSYWWTSDNSKVFYVNSSNAMTEDNGGAHKFTVRCIKQ